MSTGFPQFGPHSEVDWRSLTDGLRAAAPTGEDPDEAPSSMSEAALRGVIADILRHAPLNHNHDVDEALAQIARMTARQLQELLESGIAAVQGENHDLHHQPEGERSTGISGEYR